MRQTPGQRRKRENRIITLISDFGLKDPFTGIMKGVIYGINPDAVIVDITHDIAPQDIFEGAFALYESYKYFPKGTIHAAVVDPGVGGTRKNIIIETSDYLYVAPDNGIASLAVKDSTYTNIYEITNKEYTLRNISSTFHGRDVFAPVAAHLSKSISPSIIGKQLSDFKKLQIPEVHERAGFIEAEIIYIDKFGNLITNIANDTSERIKRIKIKSEYLECISSSYEEGLKRKPIALRGSAGFLEIAVNSGNARERLRVEKGVKIYAETE